MTREELLDQMDALLDMVLEKQLSAEELVEFKATMFELEQALIRLG